MKKASAIIIAVLGVLAVACAAISIGLYIKVGHCQEAVSHASTVVNKVSQASLYQLDGDYDNASAALMGADADYEAWIGSSERCGIG